MKRYCVSCSKTFNTLHSCYNFPAGSRQAARGAASVKRVDFSDITYNEEFGNPVTRLTAVLIKPNSITMRGYNIITFMVCITCWLEPLVLFGIYRFDQIHILSKRYTTVDRSNENYHPCSVLYSHTYRIKFWSGIQECTVGGCRVHVCRFSKKYFRMIHKGRPLLWSMHACK